MISTMLFLADSVLWMAFYGRTHIIRVKANNLLETMSSKNGNFFIFNFDVKLLNFRSGEHLETILLSQETFSIQNFVHKINITDVMRENRCTPFWHLL